MVNYIKVNGKERPFHFSYRAFKEAEMDGEGDNFHEQIEKNIYRGFKFGAIAAGQKVDFKESDIEGWIDENPEIYMQCVKLIGETRKKLLGGADEPVIRKKK